MKIAHLCLSNFYVDGFYYQENALARRHKLSGHDVLIIASTETYDDSRRLAYVMPGRYLNEHEIPVVRLPYRGEGLLPHKLIRRIRAHPGVRNELERFAPDVIFFHSLCGWELLTVASYVNDNPNVLFYADSHEMWLNSARTFFSKNVLHRIYYRWVLRRALPAIRKVLCTSLETMDFVRELYGVEPSKLEWYPLGGDILTEHDYLQCRNATRLRLGAGESDIVLYQAGKQDSRKRILESLRAFRELAAPNMKLIIAGSIDEACRAEVQSLMLTPNVTFLGWRSASDLQEDLCGVDVYLQPGSQSATMQNALCARCPVILWDYPSHRPLVDGNGWLLSDIDQLSGVLREISNNPAQLSAMSVRSVELARQYLDYGKQAERVLS